MTDLRKPIRSYVIRQGRMSLSQKRALTDLWDRYGLELIDGTLNPDDHFALLQPITIEIGFGMGDSLLEMASGYPLRNFVGIEVHKPGIGHLLREANDINLTNLRVYANDSLEVLQEVIPSKSIEFIQIFFPDPWPKRRHHKRRLVNLKLLELVANCLKLDGILHIATDWVPYAEDIQVLLENDHRFEITRNPERPLTKYEKRGMRLGHRVTDIAFRRI
jgi:tRNA (guanine-N7-)-methyltransferase